MRPQRKKRNLPHVSNLRQDPNAVSHYLPTDTCQIDPALATIVNAWPMLPEAIKAGIVAVVKATSYEDG
jgi:hypothetical protein